MDNQTNEKLNSKTIDIIDQQLLEVEREIENNPKWYSQVEFEQLMEKKKAYA